MSLKDSDMQTFAVVIGLIIATFVVLLFLIKAAKAQTWYILGQSTSYVQVQLPYSPGYQLPYSIYPAYSQSPLSLLVVELSARQRLRHLAQPRIGRSLYGVYRYTGYEGFVYKPGYFPPVPVHFGISPLTP